jgi:integrase
MGWFLKTKNTPGYFTHSQGESEDTMGVKVREKPIGSGIFWIFINHQGRRKSKKIGKDENLAMEVAKKIEAKLILGDIGLPFDEECKAPTFKEYAEKWRETYIKSLRRQSTYERYGDILKRYVYPKIGKRPIDEIKRSEIRDLLLKINSKGLSRSMICLIRDVISGPMGYAVDEEIINANPVSGILKRLKLERDKKLAIEPMDFEEVESFLKTAAKFFPEYYPFFLCAFRTGMRLGELLALQWSNIDWRGKFIKVEKAYRRGLVDLPKNGKTRRVDMSDQLEKVLRDLLTHRKKEALQKGNNEPAGIVFHRNDQHMEQNHIRRVFKKILKKAGIREMKLHITRHTFASLLLSNSESPVYVKEQLGHSSIDITVDIYGHLIPSSNREAVNRLDNLHPSAPYPHPVKKEKPQPVEIAVNSI